MWPCSFSENHYRWTIHCNKPFWPSGEEKNKNWTPLETVLNKKQHIEGRQGKPRWAAGMVSLRAVALTGGCWWVTGQMPWSPGKTPLPHFSWSFHQISLSFLSCLYFSLNPANINCYPEVVSSQPAQVSEGVLQRVVNVILWSSLPLLPLFSPGVSPVVSKGAEFRMTVSNSREWVYRQLHLTVAKKYLSAAPHQKTHVSLSLYSKFQSI